MIWKPITYSNQQFLHITSCLYLYRHWKGWSIKHLVGSFCLEFVYRVYVKKVSFSATEYFVLFV